jgi:hypothetical protein
MIFFVKNIFVDIGQLFHFFKKKSYGSAMLFILSIDDEHRKNKIPLHFPLFSKQHAAWISLMLSITISPAPTFSLDSTLVLTLRPDRHRRQPLGPQFLRHLLHATSAHANCELPDSGLEAVQRLLGHCTFNLLALARPQRVAQEFASEGAAHRTLGFVDLKLEPGVQLPEQRHHPLTCLSAGL